MTGNAAEAESEKVVWYRSAPRLQGRQEGPGQAERCEMGLAAAGCGGPEQPRGQELSGSERGRTGPTAGSAERGRVGGQGRRPRRALLQPGDRRQSTGRSTGTLRALPVAHPAHLPRP